MGNTGRRQWIPIRRYLEKIPEVLSKGELDTEMKERNKEKEKEFVHKGD